MTWEPIDYLGLVGGLILLFAFWRTNSGLWKTTSPWYEFDNVIAALILVVYAWHKHAYVNIALNIVWGIVAFRGLSSFAERRALRNKNFRKGFQKGSYVRKRL